MFENIIAIVFQNIFFDKKYIKIIYIFLIFKIIFNINI